MQIEAQALRIEVEQEGVLWYISVNNFIIASFFRKSKALSVAVKIAQALGASPIRVIE